MNTVTFIGFAIIVAVYLYLTFKKPKEIKPKQDVKPEEQIFNLFVEGESLTAPEISDRLIERTAGRKKTSDAVIYSHLNNLVRNGRILRKEIVVKVKENKKK